MPLVPLLVLFPFVATVADWNPKKLLEQQKNKSALSKEEKSLTQSFGGEKQLLAGSVRQDNLVIAFGIKIKGAKSVAVVSDNYFGSAEAAHIMGLGGKRVDGPVLSTELIPLGSDGVFVGAAQMNEGDGLVWHWVVDGKQIGDPHNLEAYTMPPEAKLMPSVTPGKLEQQPRLTSKIFGDTWHDWWVWTPANFDPAKESNLVVFQDGQWSHNYAPVYFDNMVTHGDLPQTVVVFVTPGTFSDNKSDRSREYDTLNDAYSRFLLEELLPPVEAKFKITQDPMRRCVAGLSSGGICSFTVAWQRPDKFGLVMSWIGSFTNIASGESKQAGGHNYPALIRKTEKKPIRVFLQDGANDLDNVHGNWPLSNLQMAKALEFQKYDVMAVWGNGFHSDAHGRALMVNALKWLFRKS